MKTALSVMFLFLWTGAAAQNTQPEKLSMRRHWLAVNVNPLALIKSDQLLMVGVERRLNVQWSLIGDVGIIVHSSYLQETNTATGFELRPAVRHYFGQHADRYVQGQFFFRNAGYDITGWLGKDCVNGVPAYEQLQDFTIRKQHYGAALVIGGADRISRRFLIDYSIGLGAQYRAQQLKDQPGACYTPQSTIFRNPERVNIWIPMMPIAVKLAYVIR